MKGKQN